MVTADSVKNKIRGLIDKSNAKTGHIDKDLTTAVNTLIDGFGQGSVELPEIDESVLGTADDLAEGKQLIDSNGNIVTGAVYAVRSGATQLVENARIRKLTNGDKLLLGTEYVIQDPRLFRSGSNITLLAPAENFGDATAADVAAGKTFTSAAGHKVVGTMASGGGFTVTDDGAGNVTITSSAITDNNGNVVIA